ncbi:MAG: FtsQ-type POTRA domain-containing protein [Lachnospiraceae bacterium]|nr:FtsQ-type POTRA domain-containing protein [Lachnospiraceae bacterium]
MSLYDKDYFNSISDTDNASRKGRGNGTKSTDKRSSERNSYSRRRSERETTERRASRDRRTHIANSDSQRGGYEHPKNTDRGSRTVSRDKRVAAERKMAARRSAERRAREAQEKREKERELAEPPTKIKRLTAKQRHLRTTFVYIGLFFLIVVVGVVFSVTIIFRTNKIVVEGDVPYTEQEIIEASGLDYGENIFISPRKTASKNIVDNFPYIEEAQVNFKIPGTQVITVVGAIPSYEISIGGGYVVVSSRGRVLEHNAESDPAIPLLRGVRVKDTEIGDYIKYEKSTTEQFVKEVINSINENQIPNIVGIDISNAANIKLNYDNRITISLGVPEDVGYKLRTAITIIDTELNPTDRGDLDVSLANSDRKSSYFNPVYNNMVDIDDMIVSSQRSTASSSDSGR